MKTRNESGGGAGVGTAVARLARVALATAVAFACLAGAAAVRAATLTVLHVNDTHSHLDAWGPKDHHLEGTVGGIAKAAAVIGEIRGRDSNVLLLHAGDMFHGDLFFNAFFGVPEFQLLQQLGFDAMAVGNHEFDLGPDVLAGSLAAAFSGPGLPLLSANLDLSEYPALATWIGPSIVKEVGGVRVGIFGMTNPDNVTNIPAPVVILGAGDPTALMTIAATQAAALRASGAEVVICLSHLGALYDRALAASVPGIDLIVGGHDHYVFSAPETVTNPDGKPTLIVQAGSRYEYVGCLRLSVDGGAVTVDSYELLTVDRKVAPLPEVQAVVDELKRAIVDLYGDVYGIQLARAGRTIDRSTDPRQRWRDSGMGDLITDALRARTHTDVAITANGLIDEGISRGPIVGADLFRPIGYGYDTETRLGLKIATFDITGAELAKALEVGLAYLGVNEDFFLQVSGMRFAYDPDAPAWERVVPGSIRVQGRRLDPFATYSVTVNEMIAMLLPSMDVQVTNLALLPDSEYNVLKDFVVGLQQVNYHPEGRIVELKNRWK